MALDQKFLSDTIHGEAKKFLTKMNELYPDVKAGFAVAFAYPDHQENFDTHYEYGYADQSKHPVTTETVFAIGSLTKTFTATMLAKNVIDGGMSYTDPVVSHLGGYLDPNYPPSPLMAEITLEQLARQVSGLPDVSDNGWGDGLFQDEAANAPQSLQNYWIAYREGPPPGSCWLYSDLGFITLGFAMVPDRVGYLSQLQNITGPLGMDNTVTDAVALQGVVIAEGHANGDTVSANAAPDLKSTVVDMHTLMVQNLQAPIADPQSPLQQAMAQATAAYEFTPPLNNCNPTDNPPTPGPKYMGLAWQIEHAFGTKTGPVEVIWKDGLTFSGGCSSWIGMIPAGQAPGPMGVAVLVNAFEATGSNQNDWVIADNYGWSLLYQIANAAEEETGR